MSVPCLGPRLATRIRSNVPNSSWDLAQGARGCTLQGSSTAHGPGRTRTSPSPQPSPLGRGSALAHASGDREGSGSSNDAKWLSLSPRERAGVRGKRVCERESASEVSDACKEQGPLALFARLA